MTTRQTPAGCAWVRNFIPRVAITEATVLETCHESQMPNRDVVDALKRKSLINLESKRQAPYAVVERGHKNPTPPLHPQASSAC